jgi:hypothetical protein
MQQIDNVPVTVLADFFGAGKITHPLKGSNLKTVISFARKIFHTKSS